MYCSSFDQARLYSKTLEFTDCDGQLQQPAVRLHGFCCFSSITGIRHINISRQVKITSNRMRTHMIFTSHSEMAKVTRITAMARGLAPGGIARYCSQCRM